MSIELLVRMGDHLYAIDQVTETNNVGFNKGDHSGWPMVRGNGLRMTKTLKKYLKTQLIPVFGEEAKEAVSQVYTEEAQVEVALTGLPEITPTFNPVFGSITMEYTGEIPKIVRTKFINVQKKYGLWWDSKTNRNYIPQQNVSSFNVSGYLEAMQKLGFAVASFPKLDEKPGALTLDQALSALDYKRARNLFVCRKIDGHYEFRFSFSQTLNDLFSNKTGKLTGIMEARPTDWARITNSLDLAIEAIDKAKALLPSWTFFIDGIDQAKAAHEERQALLTAPIQGVVDLLNPDFTLFPFQNEFIRFVEMSGGNCLIGAEMGLGKTVISLSWSALRDRRVLVVCPKVVRRTWIKEAQKFFPSVFTDFNTIELSPKLIKKGGLPDLSNMKIASVNFASLIKFLPAIQAAGFDTLIIDESHTIKSEKAQITQTLHSISSWFKFKILLSGTAIKNKKDELFTQIELIRPGFFESKQALKMSTIGGTWHAIQEFYKTKSKHEVLKDLPPKLSSIIELDVKNCPDFVGSISFDEIAAMKADVSMAKADATIEFIEELLDSSDSNILVFSDSVEVAKKIHEALGKQSLLHHGQMSDDAREAVKTLFQSPDCQQRVFVSTRQSLAVGATLTRADKVVFNDLPWTPADIRQAEDRTHRIGQINPVNVYWIKATGNNWDEKIISILKRKYDISKKILEGKQVSAEERQWLDTPLSAKKFAAK